MNVFVVREHPIQYLLFGKGLAAALHQHPQHCQFARGQGQWRALQCELLALAVVNQRAAGQPGVFVAPCASHQGVQACLQLRQLERFGQKVVCAGVEQAHPLVQRITRRQNQRGQALVAFAQPLQHAMAVQPRQAQVQHQRVVVGMLQGPIGHQPVADPFDLDAGVLQRPAEPGSQAVFVFCQKDAHDGAMLMRDRRPEGRLGNVHSHSSLRCRPG